MCIRRKVSHREREEAGVKAEKMTELLPAGRAALSWAKTVLLFLWLLDGHAGRSQGGRCVQIEVSEREQAGSGGSGLPATGACRQVLCSLFWDAVLLGLS